MPVNRPQSPGAASAEDVRLILSALCDGETSGPQAAAACTHWRLSAQARADWHTWSVIGDAMRAQTLCGRPDHDAQFLARLRERLADEPVVLAPAPLVARTHAGRWASAGAVAAGLAVVAGAVVMLRSVPPGSEAAQMAAAAASAPLTEVQPSAANPALAGYLDAHRQYAATAMPGGVRPVSLQPRQP